MQVVADGIFTSDVGELTEVKYSTHWGPDGGGHWLASWKFHPNGSYIGRNFNPQGNVRIANSGATCWEGEFTGATPDGNGEILAQARGHGKKLFDLDSIFHRQILSEPDLYYPTNQLAGGGSSTDYGWEYAQTYFNLDLTLATGTTLPTTPFGDSAIAKDPVKLAQVLSGRTLEDGDRWAVWRKELVIDADDFSNPLAWDAPEGFVGIQAEDYRTHIGVLYKVPVTSANPQGWSMEWATDSDMLQWFDPKSEVVDYRGLGVIGSFRALNLARQTLSQLRGRFIYEGSFTVEQGMDFPAWGPTFRAGTAMRLQHLKTSMGTLIPEGENVFIVGDTEVTWRADTDTWSLQITPMGAAPRDLAAILRGAPLDSGPQITA